MNPEHDEVLAALAKAMPNYGSRSRARISIDEAWIGIETALPRKRGTDAVRDLLLQSTWPGGVKLQSRPSGCRVGAEIPRHADGATARDWLRREAALVAAGLRVALGASPLEEAQPAAQTPADGDCGFDPAILAERCTAGGWPAVIRSDAEVRVQFQARSVHRVVSLTREGHALRASVHLDLGALAERAPDSHLALAAFLLRATHALRWARAFATGSGDTVVTAGFECLLAVPGDDRPLVIALDALATACELFGREAETLADDASLASHYLALVKNDSDRREFPAGPVPTDSVPAPGAVTEATLT